MSQEPEEQPQPWRSEAPASGIVLPIVLVAAFAVQFAAPFLGWSSADRLVWDYGLSAAALGQGRWWTLVSHIFLHGGVAHIFMNATVAFGVAAPVVRVLGDGAQGMIRFFAFFLVCGVLAGLTAVALHPNGSMPLIGASGAICGLWGAATRAGPPDQALLSPWRREAWRAYWPFLLVNVILMAALTQVGLPISWEAHLGGFVSGLLLIDLFVPRRSSRAP
jgi:membrane associated rhomboid family serine protease